MRLFRPVELTFKELPWILSRGFGRILNPPSTAFCDELMTRGYQAKALLNVLPEHNLIYVVIPKAASTRIRSTLAKVEGRLSRSIYPGRQSKYRGPRSPCNITTERFHRLATSPDTLRFSFVRNPYARAVSCWADKFAGKPLVSGDTLIDTYLAIRGDVDSNLPFGANRTLSFAEYSVFAANTARARYNVHLQVQSDIINMPGIELNVIGKVETFDTDFARVLDHLNASDEVRRETSVILNESNHQEWPSYYTRDTADRIYRAYEEDFDRFGYTRPIL